MFAILLHFGVTLVLSAHILLRRHRLAETRVAWLLIVRGLP